MSKTNVQSLMRHFHTGNICPKQRLRPTGSFYRLPEKSITIRLTTICFRHSFRNTFILDIKVLLNDNTIVNLEMQLNNYNNWPERSLGYLCRNFDNLNKGDDYSNTKAAIHIGFLDFTLFPHLPEFHATYKIQNIKNHNIYTDKFILHVIELNSIHMATEEDRNHEIDKWAALFKATTWEDIRMLSNDNPTLESAAETLYQLNMDEQLRETCERFYKAEARERGFKNNIARLTKENEELTKTLAEKEAEITRLKALLESRNITE